MALLQISEPGQGKLVTPDHPERTGGGLRKRRLAVGIDLGTTNSLVAAVRDGVAQVLLIDSDHPNGSGHPDGPGHPVGPDDPVGLDHPDDPAGQGGRYLLPSVVHYSRDAAPIVGSKAKEFLTRDPHNTIASIKRLMGRGLHEVQKMAGYASYRFCVNPDDPFQPDDPDQSGDPEHNTSVPRIITAAGAVSPVEVSAAILRTLKVRAEQELGGELSGVVITVPAYFDDAQRQATKDAARLAGLNLMRLLNEPTAAAVAYGLDIDVPHAPDHPVVPDNLDCSGSPGSPGSSGQNRPRIYAVYDFGGGTFDVSILRLHRGVFEVLATAGDAALGGDDLDHAVTQWMMEQAGVPGRPDDPGQPDDPEHAAWMRGMWRDACIAKEALSDAESVDLNIELPVELIQTDDPEQMDYDRGKDDRTNRMIRPNRMIRLKLTRDEFNRIVDPLIAKTLAPCRRTLRDAAIELGDIDAVVMVGGSTRIPRVRERVGEYFGQRPVVETGGTVQVDPEKVVALGAAMQAEVLVGNKPYSTASAHPDDPDHPCDPDHPDGLAQNEMLLLDVIPLSLGIETMGGLVEKVLSRNTTIPVARAQDFTTFKDGQTAISIHVVQGERDLVSECRSLARFELRNITPMVAGGTRVRVTFQVDADGLLSITAKELATGPDDQDDPDHPETSVQVKPSYGLTDVEIERMLRDSIHYAAEDVEVRRLRERQVEAERTLQAVRAALTSDGDDLLTNQERAVIDTAMVRLDEVCRGTDATIIKGLLHDLDKATAEFAARRMDTGIRKALAGHRLDEFDGK